MKRGLTGTILWTLLAVCVGVVLFVVKYEVKDLEHRLAGLNSEIHRNQETIHILRAEWSYLNDPARLRPLAEKHLSMKPMTPAQVATLDALPKDGIPATGIVYAAITPARLSAPLPPPATIRPADPRPGAVTTVRAPVVKPLPPPPATTAAPAPAVAPIRGGRSIVIQSPALAEGGAGGAP